MASWWPTGPRLAVADIAAGPVVELDHAVGAPSQRRSRSSGHSSDGAPSPAGVGGVILSSSGTTGTPKVVRRGPGAAAPHGACRRRPSPPLGRATRGFNPLPLFHINAEVVGLLSTLVAGSSLVLDDRFHRTGFWDLMGSAVVTWINAVPAIVSRLADSGPDETVPPGIRFIRSASAPLPVATAAGSRRARGSR